MTNKLTLGLIGNSYLAHEFTAIEERARHAGFKVIRYADNDKFLASEADHVFIDILLCMGNTRCDSGLIWQMPKLRALLSAVTGIEGFDVDAATDRGILIGNGQTELNYLGMAEATILMILAALYDFNGTQDILRKGVPRPYPLRAHLLRGRTVGFVGFGRIAQEVAARLASWNVSMIAYIHRPNAKLDALGVKAVELDELLRQANIVSLHCNLNAETHHIIDARRLALMRSDAILINTARGPLIDEVALTEALVQGCIAGAALDAFEVEPLAAESQLRDLPNVVLTPHMIGHTSECNETIRDNAWESISRVARGEPPVLLKNPGALALWKTRFATQTALD